MVTVDGQSSSVLHRAGVPLSAPHGTTTPPMDVIRPRKEGSAVAVAAAAIAASSSSSTSSTSAATSTTGGAVLNGNPMQLLSRALSGSTLNAEAPEFVPKSVIMTSSLSSSVPGPAAQGLGLSPPMLMQSPSSFPPVIVAPFMVQHDVSLPTLGIPAAVATSPVGGDLVSACHSGTIFLGKEQDQAPLHGATGVVAAAAAKQPVVVTEELKAKIVKQVEFYFSDTNLPTDHHLMKYVKKDPQGFVPIPVVASFKKIKNLVKNHGVVAAALRNSLQLVVSEDGKKVRRLHALPEIDLEEVQARTVVAENLPIDYSVEKLEELFGKVGSVKMVRICHPEAPNGGNQTAVKLPKSDMVISNKLHALVEYETVDLAEKAVAELTDERNWRSGLRVRLLLRRTNKHGNQHVRWKGSGEGAEMGLGGEDDDKAQGKGGEDHGAQQVDQTDEGNECSNERDGGSKKGRGHGRGRGGRGRGQHHHQHSGTPPQSSFSLTSENLGRPPPGPRMPDGTRGFSFGRGRLLAVKTLA
ncbi:unnamed protein product [Sphagnum jensenii]|uniref:La-related protein 6B n=1 Tax=Sphagnum jensenii TaxID=128206 RepID=A0ABP1BUR2_9BRYO